MDIRWLDGKTSEGQFVLRFDFRNGTSGFMKTPCKKDAVEKRDFYSRLNPEIVETTIFDPYWNKVA
jgi:hypothetical protein